MEETFKTIMLAGGQIAIVDKEDFTDLCRFKWHFHGGYAYREHRKTNLDTGICVFEREAMHRKIMKPSREAFIDDINVNRLDNRRSNLRLATRKENARNVPARNQAKKTSAFKGVSKAGSVWLAQIGKDYKKMTIGTYESEVDAALAYNTAAAAHFGEFAWTNRISAWPRNRKPNKLSMTPERRRESHARRVVNVDPGTFSAIAKRGQITRSRKRVAWELFCNRRHRSLPLQVARLIAQAQRKRMNSSGREKTVA
jgi:hypothetical protein